MTMNQALKKLIERYSTYISNLQYNAKQMDIGNKYRKDAESKIKAYQDVVDDLKQLVHD